MKIRSLIIISSTQGIKHNASYGDLQALVRECRCACVHAHTHTHSSSSSAVPLSKELMGLHNLKNKTKIPTKSPVTFLLLVALGWTKYLGILKEDRTFQGSFLLYVPEFLLYERLKGSSLVRM